MTEGRRTNWGRWGSEDERGALNLLDASAVLRAVARVRSGRVYALGLPIDARAAPIIDGRGEPRRLTLTCDSDDERYASFGAPQGVGGNQDVVMMASHHGTHIDALSHVFADRAMYNGFPSSTFKSFSGASRLGVEKLGVIVGRGVLLDVAAHLGQEVLPPGYCISGQDLESCAAAEGIAVGAGDIMLVRTGWLEWWQKIGAGDPTPSGQPGIGVQAAEFVRDRDVAAVGADNSAVEVTPFDQGRFLAVHIELLVNLGVPLLEHLFLADLARDHVHEFLFVAAPLPVTGAAGSPLNPVAIA
ncbi:MAG: cyclase family protein [Acidimicrobiales bacterium]